MTSIRKQLGDFVDFAYPTLVVLREATLDVFPTFVPEPAAPKFVVRHPVRPIESERISAAERIPIGIGE